MPLQIQRFHDVAAFKAATLPYLREHAVHLNQLLAACERMTQAAADREQYFLACLREGDQVIAVACCMTMLPLRHLSLSVWPAHALPLLAAALGEFPVDGIVGPDETAALCAAELGFNHLRTRMLNYVLTSPPRPRHAQGQVLPVERASFALLADWIAAFEIECELPPRPRASLLQGFEEDLRPGSQRRYQLLIVDCIPVVTSCVIQAGFVARIGPVYTPFEQRGKGYAAALVTHQAATAFTLGAKLVCLYADAANPVSNALYQRLGFEIKNAFKHFSR